MIPTTIVNLENYSGFLITHDNINWWKSVQLPNTVDIISNPIWAYGQYHICSAKLTNGTYSIFRSSDNGYNWTQVLNISDKINKIVRIDYGRILAATSTGWYRSENSGKDWTKVSTQAPNCHSFKEITNNILIALDGEYIWRSTDSGTTWTKSYRHGTTSPVIARTIYPSVDGTYSDLFVGCTYTDAPYYHSANNKYYGPFTNSQYSPPTVTAPPSNSTDILIYSEDGGVSFYKLRPFRGWTYRESLVRSEATSVPLNNGWETSTYRRYYVDNTFPRPTYTDIITDIELTGVNELGLCQFVIQVKMINGKMRHYWVRTIVEDTDWLNAKLWPITTFDAVSSLSDNLFSEEILMTGSTDVQRTVLFSGSNGTIPLLKKSTNGGETWTDIDIENISIYTGPDMSQISSGSNNFIDDNYLKYAWKYPICHNGWKLDSGYIEKNQSFDMDFLTAFQKELTYEMVSHIRLPTKYTYYDFDVVNKKIYNKTWLMDELIKKTVNKNYLHGVLIQDEFVSSIDMFLDLAVRLSVQYDNDVLNKIVSYKTMFYDVLLFDTPEKTYGMEIKLIDDHVEQIMNSIERYSPQSPDIRYPDIPYVPYDSRTQNVTL